MARSRDIFWLKDDSLADSASLPDFDVLAAEIVEDLQAALDEFALIAADSGEIAMSVTSVKVDVRTRLWGKA